MTMICPSCRERSLDHRAAMELPPDAHSDEITVQVLGCARCGHQTIAVYEESRRGEGESWRHTLYENGSEDVAAVAAAIARCPDPSSKHCTCAEHQAFGSYDSAGVWKGLAKAGINLLGGGPEQPEGPDPFVGRYVLNRERSEFGSALCPWNGATVLISNDGVWTIHALTRSYPDGSIRTLTNRMRLDGGTYAAANWGDANANAMSTYRVSANMLRQIEWQDDEIVWRYDLVISADRELLTVTHFVFDALVKYRAVRTEVFDRIAALPNEEL